MRTLRKLHNKAGKCERTSTLKLVSERFTFTQQSKIHLDDVSEPGPRAQVTLSTLRYVTSVPRKVCGDRKHSGHVLHGSHVRELLIRLIHGTRLTYEMMKY